MDLNQEHWDEVMARFDAIQKRLFAHVPRRSGTMSQAQVDEVGEISKAWEDILAEMDQFAKEWLARN